VDGRNSRSRISGLRLSTGKRPLRHTATSKERPPSPERFLDIQTEGGTAMTAQSNRALDRNEALWVDQTERLTDHTDRELADLIKLIRARRDRAQRLIRTRSRSAQRQGEVNIDSGAREKKALLNAAIDRISQEIKRRKDPVARAETATANLRDAVQRKTENPSWTGPEDFTANDGPAETPNAKIAPSGALHAEGMRAAIARSTGDR